MSKQVCDAVICSVKQLNEKYFSLAIQPILKWDNISAGQFIQVAIPNSTTVFLRRPISVHDVDEQYQTIHLLIQKVGKGTEALSILKPNDLINIVYPLGKGFSLLPAGKKALLVGGGCGMAPLLYLAKKLYEQQVSSDILIGVKQKKDLIEREKYIQYGNVYVTTEDGSEGEKGLVTHHSIMNKLSRYDMIYTCGPEIMMKVVSHKAHQAGVSCEVSLENTMACGIGACLCCVTKTVQGHQCVCTEGPVFNSNELLW